MESVTRERLLLINLLAIDTALSACSVALLAHGRVSMLPGSISNVFYP